MSSDPIDDKIIERVRDYLEFHEDIPPTRLYEMLYNYRNSVHPDRYQTDPEKAKAEERFKMANGLLHELRLYLERRALTLTPKDIVPLERDYELVIAYDDAIRKDEELVQFKTNLEYAELNVKNLQEQLKALASDRSRAVGKELVHDKGPRAVHATAAAVGIALGVSWTALSEFSDLVQKIRDSIPVGSTVVDWIAVGVIFLPIVWLVVRVLRKARVERWLRLLTLSSFAQGFQEYLEKRDSLASFTDADAREYVIQRMRSPRIWCRLTGKKTNSDMMIEELTNYFLLTLISRELIERTGTIGILVQYRLTGWYSLKRSRQEEDKASK